jgi:hypothetical protein
VQVVARFGQAAPVELKVEFGRNHVGRVARTASSFVGAQAACLGS